MTPTDSQTPKMSHKQETALAALLTAPTIAIAASAAGISEATLLRWLKDEQFATAYRDARRAVVSHAVTKLQAGCASAVRTLLAVAEDAEAPASSRVSAARSVLDFSMKAVELEDLAERVETMEQRLAAHLLIALLTHVGNRSGSLFRSPGV
jgi:hypothetical protein